MNKLILIIGFTGILIMFKYVDNYITFMWITSFVWLFWSSLLEELDRIFNNKR